MTDEKQASRGRFLTNIAFWAVILAIVYFVFKYLINLIMPFFLALIFAALSRPLARLLSSETKTVKDENGNTQEVRRKIRLNHNFAAVLSVVLLFLVIIGFVTLICLRLANTGAEMVAQLPDFYYNTVQPGIVDGLATVEQWAADADDSVLALVRNSIPNIVSSIGAKVTDFSATVLVWLSSLAGSLPSVLLNTLICLIATVFIAVDFDDISAFMHRNLPARPLAMVLEIKDSFIEVVWQFVRSYFYIFLITATEIIVGLLIIGQKNALLLALLIALFDAFPIVGSGMILLPWTLWTILSGSTAKGLGLLVLYLVVVIARQIIEPKLVGKRVGLRPIVTLVCMFVGTKLFGGLGLFGLPIMAAIITDMNNDGVISLFKPVGGDTREQKAEEAPKEEAPNSENSANESAE